ncbi:cadherin domain-containing protein [Luteolibacter yonseiensis]|uniref:Cadherin domain-containing protein n=1 Tax=Luteolibacter yonseiensis TaxID=1144680 RepID=A0A934R7T6_9BACT|nr:M60 family metallopeptidase [Luteolibacter yonseiensis]MBK1817756.1 cadherin domain-containing protein [Luteolibacter yonseiensis]
MFTASSRADLSGDYASLVSGAESQVITAPGTPGTVAMFGTAAFPVLLGTAGPPQSVMGAGRYGDSYAGTAARAVGFSHTGFFDTVAGPRGTLFANSVLWASRQPVPVGTIAVVVGNTAVGTFLTTAGYTVRNVSSGITDANLNGAHVLILGGNTDYSNTVMTRIAGFATAGGGIVMSATPWAASAGAYADSNEILKPFGLVFTGDYSADPSYTVAPAAHPAINSALVAADALIADKEGTAVMTAANRGIAANAIFQVTQVRIDIPTLAAKLDILGDATHYGIIAPTLASPINTTAKPVEKMLARYQSQTYDAMAPGQLFAHPCAADFPGSAAAGAIPVSRTVTVNGNTATDFYMNQGGKPTRVETGVYAAPGATVTVAIPVDKIAQGLQVLISPNGSEDSTFDTTTWTFFPKLWRRVPLTQAATQTGSVLGGLVTILVPAGKSLGNFEVTVHGGIKAPAFVLGQTTDAEWNDGIKNNPAPYGYIRNEKLTLYLPSAQLSKMSNPTEVTAYWKQVMDIADDCYGYSNYRKRAEVVSTSRYVAYGAAYAGYPIEAGWGTDAESLLNSARVNGDWGTYHELGHGFQDDFDSSFVIATSAEVDVNLFPGMIYTILHDRTAWDGAHSSYDAVDRIAARNTYLALPVDQQTWQKANDSYPVAYDFYFNLAEAFGWQCYKTALSRLMRYLQDPTSATDAPLKALNTADPNFKRNRFYLLFCDATGRNLDAYFQRYGLGKAGAGFEITQSVKDQIAAKGYPTWTGNTPIDSLSTPPALSLREDSVPGTEIYQFSATDAEEPGQIYEYSITGGNPDNAFSIDKRTGRLRVQKVDAETLASHTLTVQVQDCGVPRYAATQTFTINILNTGEPPQVEGKLLTATKTMADGTSLGTPAATVEQGRTVVSRSIVAGNDGHFAINSSTGAITVTNASTLPDPGVIVLTVKVTDSSGASGFGTATILCNRTKGILEERWAGSAIGGNPSSTSTYTTFTSAQNVSNNYIRRVSGWLIPMKTGIHTFWISSDDGSTLSLSTDGTEANKRAIATVSGYTNFQQWTASSSQKSQPVFLEMGRAYYIEAIQTEGSGGDHVSVAWEGPGIARQVIPNAVLIPRNATAAFPPRPSVPTVSLTTPDSGERLFTPGTFPVSATPGDNTLTIFRVAFFDGETLIGEDDTPPYSINWINPEVGPHSLSARVFHTVGTLDSIAITVTVAPQTPMTSWQNAKFGAAAGDPSVSGPHADPNHNGLVNLLEYALGTEPNSPFSSPPVRGAIFENRLTLSFSRNTSASDVVLKVQASDEVTGQWSDLAVSTDGGAFSALIPGVVVTESPGGATRDVSVSDFVANDSPAPIRRFMRVHASLR